MLIEIWERLRGYDKWIETEATIKRLDSEVIVAVSKRGSPIYGQLGDDEITWIDEEGAIQRETLVVSTVFPVYKIYDGNPVLIRYNPDSPRQFYVREIMRCHVNTWAIGTPAILILYLVLNHYGLVWEH